MAGRRSKPSRGFTLVEILIVVVILAVLSALTVPSFVGAMEQTTQGAFITDVKIFGDAAALYYAKNGEYLEDSSSGELPTGFDELIDERVWLNPTPVGGVWDSESYDTGGYASAVGVHFDGTGKTRDDAYMLVIDQTFDDGDLEAGNFRRIANGRYYYIVAE